LRNTDKRWAKLLERINQIGLIECLERTGYDGPTDKRIPFHPDEVILASEWFGKITIVWNQWEAIVDDVKVSIEELELFEYHQMLQGEIYAGLS
jgi:hypothetical protein